MIASFIGGNVEFSRQYIAGDIELEYVPQVSNPLQFFVRYWIFENSRTL